VVPLLVVPPVEPLDSTVAPMSQMEIWFKQMLENTGGAIPLATLIAVVFATGKIDKDVAVQANKLDKLDKDLTKLDNKLDKDLTKLDNKLDETKKELTAKLDENKKELTAKLDQLTADFALLISKLDKDSKKVNKKVNKNVNKKMTEMKSTLDKDKEEMKAHIALVSTDMNDIKANVTQLSHRLEKIESASRLNRQDDDLDRQAEGQV